MNQEQLEYLHESGKMPDRYYYQQNGGTAQQNYNRQHKNLLKGYKKNQQFEDYVFSMINAMLETALKGILDELKGFN